MARHLSVKKYLPAFLQAQVQTDDIADDAEAQPAEGSVTPDKMDRQYIEAGFGEAAEGEPPGILRRIVRMWVQDGQIYGESDDEF